MCDLSNTDTFLRSALYSATTCYELGWLRQLLTSQEDAKEGTIIFIFKKRHLQRVPQNTQTYEKYPQEILASKT